MCMYGYFLLQIAFDDPSILFAYDIPLAGEPRWSGIQKSLCAVLNQ